MTQQYVWHRAYRPMSGRYGTAHAWPLFAVENNPESAALCGYENANEGPLYTAVETAPRCKRCLKNIARTK